MYGEDEVYLQAFLTSALDSGEWRPSRLGSFSLREESGVQTGQAPELVWTLLPLIGIEPQLCGHLTRSFLTILNHASSS
jgi:hypothetical protein